MEVTGRVNLSQSKGGHFRNFPVETNYQRIDKDSILGQPDNRS